MKYSSFDFLPTIYQCPNPSGWWAAHGQAVPASGPAAAAPAASERNAGLPVALCPLLRSRGRGREASGSCLRTTGLSIALRPRFH